MLRGVIAGILGVALGLVSPACTSTKCSDRIAAMRAVLAQVPEDAWSSESLPVNPLRPLPLASRGEWVRDARRLMYVDRDGTVRWDGSPGGISTPQLLAELPSMFAGEPALYVGFDPGLQLAPHRGWLMELARTVPLRVLVRVPTPPPTPGGEASLTIVKPELIPKCRTTGHVPECSTIDRPRILTAAMRRAAPACEPLATGLAAAVAAAPERRQQRIIDAVIAGAEACGCEHANIDGITALTWFLLMGEDPGLRWLPLQLDLGARRLIHADATAQELAAILVEEPHLGFAPH